ncbi:hypothetical protein GE21DRAFT_1219180, partial [Neurospora crassa]
LLEVKDNLISYVEATLLLIASLNKVKDFFKFLFLKWGYFLIVLVNSGVEFQKAIIKYLLQLGILRESIVFYNLRANSINK